MPAAPDRTAFWRMLGLVVLGGAIGVGIRAAVLLPVGEQDAAIATLVVNAIGSGILGLVVGALADRHPLARTFLGTGVLGGFTTYSAFAVQTAAAGPLPGLALAAASIVLGLVAAFAGLMLGRRLAGRSGDVEPPQEAE